MKRILGIDVGGTYTRYGLVVDSLVSKMKKVETKSILDFEFFVVNLVDSFEVCIDAIGIGFPGVVTNNVVVSVPNVETKIPLDIVARLNKKLKIEVFVFRDVELLFLQHIKKFELSALDNVIGFYFGTGIGNTIKLNGTILHGENGAAGELGHIPVLNNYLVCECGKIGCIETLVSGKALLKLQKELFPKTIISDVFFKHKNEKVVSNFILNMAKTMAIEINILNINAIIIGGGIVNMKGFPKDVLKSELKKHISQRTIDFVKFIDDDPKDGIIGASIAIEGELWK